MSRLDFVNGAWFDTRPITTVPRGPCAPRMGTAITWVMATIASTA